MRQNHHLDIVFNHLRIERHIAQSEELPKAIHHRERLAHRGLAHHHGTRVAIQRQGRHHANHRAARVGKLIDQARQIKFQEALTIRLEEGDIAFVIQQIRADQAEINLLTRLIHRHALQAESQRAVLGFAEGLWVQHFKPKLAARDRDIFIQHRAHAFRIGAKGRDGSAKLPRIKQPQRHRVLQARQYAARAIRQRVKFLRCQIEPRARRETLHQHIDADGKCQRRHHAKRRGPDSPRAGLCLHLISHGLVSLPMVKHHRIHEKPEPDEGRKKHHITQRNHAAREAIEAFGER